MKKIVIFTCLLLSLSLAGSASAAVLIDLDAADLTEGLLDTWVNEGTAGGAFLTADRTEVDGTDPNALVEIVDGVKAVSFADGAWMESTITAPNEIVLDNPWSIVTWVYTFSSTAEDCIFQWADRGGNETANTAHFNFGERAFTNFFNDVFYDEVPPSGQWVHLAMTYDQTDIRLYINGIANTVAGRAMNITEGHYMRLARSMPDLWGTHPLDGAIASLQVYDEALSQEQIQQLGGVFEPGNLSPAGLVILEGAAAENITVQVYMNPLTSAGPTEDLEVTLSFGGTYTDASLGTSAPGEPYVVTVPAASYSTPIQVPIIAEDDAVQEGTHNVLIEAVVTAGDPDYAGLTLTPFGGLAVQVRDNDFDPCPEPAFSEGAYIDEFDCPWDFGLGMSGMWDGMMNAGRVIAAETISAPGLLTFDGTGNWNGNETTGPFLYIDVTGDFVAEVHQVAPVTSGGGLMVRLGGDLALGGPGEDNMWLAAWSSWDVGSIYWPVDDGGRPEEDITWDAVDGPTWMRVERRGAQFYWSRSYDGVNWEALPSASPDVREDMNVATLQVGIIQAFGGAPVEYDYFKLTPTRGSITGTLNLTEVDADSGNVQFQLDTEGLLAPFADIDVTLSAVAVAGADPNSDPNDVIIGDALKGEPYSFTIPASEYADIQQIPVTAVADAIPEPDQQLTLTAQIASADPNWNGLLIASDALINILETPGLLLDTGDGVETSENGDMDTFTVRLKIPPLAPVTVDISDNADPDQATVDQASLFFDAATWKTPQIVTVSAVDDAILENDPHQTTLSLATTNGNEYDTLAPAGVTVTIQENECGAWDYLWADFDRDCDVDITDLSIMAAEWLSCTRPHDVGCDDLR